MCLSVFSISIGYRDNCMGCVKILRKECEVNICTYMRLTRANPKYLYSKEKPSYLHEVATETFVPKCQLTVKLSGFSFNLL